LPRHLSVQPVAARDEHRQHQPAVPEPAWSRCPDPPFDSFPFSFVALAGTHYVSVQPCPAGDVNGDGCVDDADLLIVLFNFGNAGGQGDVNNDNIVDDADLLIVLFNFGAGC
jgi:hypothetical protein